MSSANTVRFRYSQAIWVAAAIAFIGGIPLASVHWALVPVLLVPLLIGVWGWRAGTDATPDELRLRALFGRRVIPWREIHELTTDGRGRVIVLLANGQTTTLPAVRKADLPNLIGATGQKLPEPSAS